MTFAENYQRQEEIEQLFRFLRLETDEQRSAMQFDSVIVERCNPVQTITTGSTSPLTQVLEGRTVA